MSFDTPKWNENNEINNTTDSIKEQNINIAKKFAEQMYLDDLDKDEFNEFKKSVLDEISSVNWKIAFENVKQKLRILYDFRDKLISKDIWDFATKSNIMTTIDNLERSYDY